jgi:hypothetical protein
MHYSEFLNITMELIVTGRIVGYLEFFVVQQYIRKFFN